MLTKSQKEKIEQKFKEESTIYDEDIKKHIKNIDEISNLRTNAKNKLRAMSKQYGETTDDEFKIKLIKYCLQDEEQIKVIEDRLEVLRKELEDLKEHARTHKTMIKEDKPKVWEY